MRMHGNLGWLQVGYLVSVEFTDWNLTCAQEVMGVVDWSLTGKVSKLDTMWSTQPPTEVRLSVQPGVWWRWKGSIEVTGTVAIGKTVSVRFRGEMDILGG